MLKGKVILITGGTGSIGRELAKKILKHKPAQLRVFSRDESKQHALREELGCPQNLRFLIGDIRDKERTDYAFRDVDIVFHAAALKHVPSCEYNPFETVHTNIIGSQNVINAALSNNVDRVVAISTDKVVNPTSVMGTSKLMMEKLIINANYHRGNKPTKFSCVRFGNVAWARGSVLPLWKKQIEKNRKITVTNNEMTRFMMSIENAVDLVLEAGNLMQEGEIFILKMPAIPLSDLAKEFIVKYYPEKKIKIQITGDRAGEKIHEGLISAEDGDVLENSKMFISIPNVWSYTGRKEKKRKYSGFKKRKDKDAYLSSEHIDIKKVKKII